MQEQIQLTNPQGAGWNQAILPGGNSFPLDLPLVLFNPILYIQSMAWLWEFGVSYIHLQEVWGPMANMFKDFFFPLSLAFPGLYPANSDTWNSSINNWKQRLFAHSEVLERKPVKITWKPRSKQTAITQDSQWFGLGYWIVAIKCLLS